MRLWLYQFIIYCLQHTKGLHDTISAMLAVFLIISHTASPVVAQTAVKVKSFSIKGSGSGPRMRMGDLNGDGRLDILMVQATNETPSEVQMLTAYDGFNGERLWQVMLRCAQ